MKKISLYGAGGHCFAAVELIRSLGEYNPIIVFDDQPKFKTILDVPVKTYSDELLKTDTVCISIGNNSNRKKIAQQIKSIFPSFKHSSAVQYPSALVGDGVLILPNAVLDADTKIGNFCIVNNNATISHNVYIEDFVHIAINVAIAGAVKIGEGTLLGAGCVILPEIKIGKWATIGAGAIITKDVPDYAVIYGNPSKIVNYNNK